MQYVISTDSSKVGGYNILINNQEIDDKVFEEEMVNWRWEDRVDIIEQIQCWLCEARQARRTNDATMMDQDIDYLKTLNDNYIFSSISTNCYVALSENPYLFDEICEDILGANVKLKSA